MPLPKLLSVVIPALALCVDLSSPAQALEAMTVSLGRETGVDRIREGRTTLAPFAFTRFCVSNPADCIQSGDDALRWTDATQRLVRRINAHVNRSIVARNESGDDWNADVKRGDCEDFALTKRRELIRNDIPASALSMAIARTADGEGHAVLVVRTNEGDLVLDNRTDRLLKWHQTDLRWMKISSAEDPRVWHMIN